MWSNLQHQIELRLRAQRVAYFRNLRSRLGIYDYEAWVERERQ